MTDNEEQDDRKGGFVVRDKRRFDSDGNERNDKAEVTVEYDTSVRGMAGQAASKPASQPKQPMAEPVRSETVRSEAARPEPAPSRPGAAPRSDKSESDEAGFTMQDSEGDDEGGEVDFASFVMSLATQALMQLGEMRPPPGMELPIDREASKQTIDILSMLRAKTRGNLSAVETKLIDDILHNLRISYLRKA